MRKRQRKKNIRRHARALGNLPREVAISLVSHVLVGAEAFRLAFGCLPSECGIVGNRITFTRRG